MGFAFKQAKPLNFCSFQEAYENSQGFIHHIKSPKTENFILREGEQIIVKNTA